MVTLRKKPIVGGLLAAILGLGLLVYFGWRPLLVAQFTPPDHFNQDDAPSPPDYTSSASWVAHPSKTSAALLMPEGEDKRVTKEAAVFYVHPTTYFAGDKWNWTLDNSTHAQQGIEHVIATQASAFSGCCDIYAPYYRQAHISAFGAGSEASLQALDLAYLDIERSFNRFLEEIGSDTPFFLAGHSQGSAHLHRLISKVIDGTPIKNRMVAAYVVGYWLPADISTRSFPGIPLCAAADQTSCFVTWDTYDRNAEEMPFFSVPHWLAGGWERLDEVVTACVNPLSWKVNTAYVSNEHNLGAVESKPAGGLMDIIFNRNPGVTYERLGQSLPNASSAECLASGKLLADTQHDNEFGRSGDGDSGSYHAFDWNLFYHNIRQNIVVRLEAYGNENF